MLPLPLIWVSQKLDNIQSKLSRFKEKFERLFLEIVGPIPNCREVRLRIDFFSTSDASVQKMQYYDEFENGIYTWKPIQTVSSQMVAVERCQLMEIYMKIH